MFPIGMFPQYNRYFVSGDGLDGEVIQAGIHSYLGGDAVVYPDRRCNPWSGYMENGFSYLARRELAMHEIKALKSYSMQRQEERQAEEGRQYYGEEGVLPPAPTQSTWVSPPDEKSPLDAIDDKISSIINRNSHIQQSQYESGNQRHALTRSQSEPVINKANDNIRDIRLVHPETGTTRNSVAFLDTGCQTGNWVSRQTVEKLGAEDLIDDSEPVKKLQAGNMGMVKSKGTIKLEWRWMPKGVKLHAATFYVTDAFHYDLIIGNEYIAKYGLIKYNEEAFSPLTEHDPVISPYESEEIKKAKEKQQQQKADREAAKQKTGSSHRSRDKEHRKRR